MTSQSSLPHSLGDKMASLLSVMRKLPGCASLGRIAVALYDPQADLLRAYAQTGNVLDRYEVALGEVPSLALLATGEEPRVVDDLLEYGWRAARHTAALSEAGFRSSLTLPVWRAGNFLGFVFLNSTEPAVFTDEVVKLIRPFVNGIAEMTVREVGLHQRA